MKILRQPDADGSRWAREVVCSCCGAVLEIARDDVRQTSWWTVAAPTYAVTCPLCDTTISVPRTLLTEPVRRYVDDRTVAVAP